MYGRTVVRGLSLHRTNSKYAKQSKGKKKNKERPSKPHFNIEIYESVLTHFFS